jgi:tetratricopeptide (TPR) repeat protein
MKRTLLLIVLLSQLAGCAHLPGSFTAPRERALLWSDAQTAFVEADFLRAQALFDRLARSHPRSLEGRESLFFLGAIYLDPRNPGWDSEPAEDWLSRYLELAENRRLRLYRYPEAQTLHELARQLNLPADDRVAGLQPEERVVQVEERVIVPAEQNRALTVEVERLRQQLAERDARIRQQQDELERIRRTLTGPGRQP